MAEGIHVEEHYYFLHINIVMMLLTISCFFVYMHELHIKTSIVALLEKIQGRDDKTRNWKIGFYFILKECKTGIDKYAY